MQRLTNLLSYIIANAFGLTVMLYLVLAEDSGFVVAVLGIAAFDEIQRFLGLWFWPAFLVHVLIQLRISAAIWRVKLRLPQD